MLLIHNPDISTYHPLQRNGRSVLRHSDDREVQSSHCRQRVLVEQRQQQQASEKQQWQRKDGGEGYGQQDKRRTT